MAESLKLYDIMIFNCLVNKRFVCIFSKISCKFVFTSTSLLQSEIVCLLHQMITQLCLVGKRPAFASHMKSRLLIGLIQHD